MKILLVLCVTSLPFEVQLSSCGGQNGFSEASKEIKKRYVNYCVLCG